MKDLKGQPGVLLETTRYHRMFNIPGEYIVGF